MIVVVFLFSGETHSLFPFYINLRCLCLRLSIYYAGTIMLFDYNTFISFSSVTVISLTLEKYFYYLTNKLQLPLIQLNYIH